MNSTTIELNDLNLPLLKLLDKETLRFYAGNLTRSSNIYISAGEIPQGYTEGWYLLSLSFSLATTVAGRARIIGVTSDTQYLVTTPNYDNATDRGLLKNSTLVYLDGEALRIDYSRTHSGGGTSICNLLAFGLLIHI